MFRHFLEEKGMWELYVEAYNEYYGYLDCGTDTSHVDDFLSSVEPVFWSSRAFAWECTHDGYGVWRRLDDEWQAIVGSVTIGQGMKVMDVKESLEDSDANSYEVGRICGRREQRVKDIERFKDWFKSWWELNEYLPLDVCLKSIDIMMEE